MRRNRFILLIVLSALLVANTCVLAQETINPIPGPAVQEEQKLMVTIRLEITEGGVVHTKNQEGFALYPQTVITALDPMLVLGARATIIYQGQMIPAIKANINPRLKLVTLLLVQPLAVDTQKTNFFSENYFDKNTFFLTQRSIINIDDLTEENTKENRLRGAVAVDDYGTLLGIVLSVEKDVSGTLTPQMIPFDLVKMFIKSLKQGPPIPQFNLPEDSRPGEAPEKSVNLNTI